MNKKFSQIVINNLRRDGFLSRSACKNNAAIRKVNTKEKYPDRINIRPAFFHDTDRIMHSLAYTRYIDKTQVFYLFANDHITHRALHVQLVSKIARVIGRALQLNEDLIEAIALGHDIGHVPFGHDGERFLNDICQKNKIGYFCHNAQSVKFLSEIEDRGKGLNLTLQVLDGILAHNGEMIHQEYRPNKDKDWSIFENEYVKCFTEKDYSKKIIPMTLEACVVRISDVIAYVGRDIEDAIILKIIKRKQIPNAITKLLGNRNRDIVNKLVLDLINMSFGHEYLKFSKKIFQALSDLKDFNYNNIYFHSAIRSENDKIEKLFTSLYKRLLEDAKNEVKESPIMKAFITNMYKEYRSKYSLERQVIDFLSGMTDDYFNYLCSDYFIPKSYGYSFTNKFQST